MKPKNILTIASAAIAVTAVLSLGQAPPAAAPKSGPGIQAPQDAREPELLKTCKTPPPARGGARGGGPARGRGPAAPAGPRDYTVTEIPGVIAAGQKWTEVWTGTGNNADGPVATKDGGLLVAQNTDSTVMKLDKDGKASILYRDTNTGGALSMNKKGVLFVNERGLKESIVELAPEHKTLVDNYKGDPIDCIGGALNDLSADSKGGAYFTLGVVWYADAKGTITRYGDGLTTNGIILSADEKTLYVTNGTSLVAFDVQKDGSLTNQREFAKLEGTGADGSTIDAAGRIYVTSSAGIEVIGPDGKHIGVIPTPLPVITTAFSGKDKKTLYAIANNQREDHIYTIPMIAQGYKGRAK
jgi:sugar lactone lactonase YvrE